MDLIKILSLLVISIFLFPVQNAMAQRIPICDVREKVVEKLEAARFQESHRILGIINDQSVLEIWVNENTGGWTALITSIHGSIFRSCLVSGGTNLMILPKPKKKVPSIDH